MLVQSSIIKIEVWAWRYREVLVPSSIKAIVEVYSILLHLLSLIIATGQHIRSKKILFCLHLFSSTYYSSSTFVFWGERERRFFWLSGGPQTRPILLFLLLVLAHPFLKSNSLVP